MLLVTGTAIRFRKVPVVPEALFHSSAKDPVACETPIRFRPGRPELVALGAVPHPLYFGVNAGEATRRYDLAFQWTQPPRPKEENPQGQVAPQPGPKEVRKPRHIRREPPPSHGRPESGTSRWPKGDEKRASIEIAAEKTRGGRLPGRGEPHSEPGRELPP